MSSNDPARPVSLDPIHRFSSRVEDYVRYRPGYPPEIIPLLERECGLTSGYVIADVGSGTGLLSNLFLKFGCRVIGIEPNAEMRRAGQLYLNAFQKFESIGARAECTALRDASVDLITAGTAFHWFNASAARTEFRRISREPHWMVLVWNERRIEPGFLAGYDRMLHRYVPEYEKGTEYRRMNPGAINDFFGHDQWRRAEFPNQQEFDFEGVRGRLLSSSYAPPPGGPNYQPMIEELKRLFEEFENNGQVEFRYDTKLYYGQI